jgi:hypothetical protein
LIICFKEIKQLFDTNDNHFWNLYLENLDTSILEIIYKIVFFDLKFFLNEMNLNKIGENSTDSSLFIQIKLHVSYYFIKNFLFFPWYNK